MANGKSRRKRQKLRAVVYRMLGSVTEADDAVQEPWLQLYRTGCFADSTSSLKDGVRCRRNSFTACTVSSCAIGETGRPNLPSLIFFVDQQDLHLLIDRL